MYPDRFAIVPGSAPFIETTGRNHADAAPGHRQVAGGPIFDRYLRCTVKRRGLAAPEYLDHTHRQRITKGGIGSQIVDGRERHLAIGADRTAAALLHLLVIIEYVQLGRTRCPPRSRWLCSSQRRPVAPGYHHHRRNGSSLRSPTARGSRCWPRQNSSPPRFLARSRRFALQGPGWSLVPSTSCWRQQRHDHRSPAEQCGHMSLPLKLVTAYSPSALVPAGSAPVKAGPARIPASISYAYSFHGVGAGVGLGQDGSTLATECWKPGLPCGSGCLRTTSDESPAFTSWF